MRLTPLSALATLTVALGLYAAPDASALRCRQRVVSSGDTQAEVRARCGEPTAVSVRTEESQNVVRGADGEIVRIDVVTTVIELWTYDFGPQRLMVELAFREGRLESETTLGYGTDGHTPPDGAPPRR